METFEELKSRLQECKKMSDTEFAHYIADDILMEVGLSTTLTKEQREELVKLYNLVNKWYA